MATVRELRALFTAKADGFKSEIKSVQSALRDMRRTSDNATKGMSKGYQDTGKRVDRFKNKVENLEIGIDNQSEAVKKATKHHENMAKQYGENSKEAKRARVELDNQLIRYEDMSSQLQGAKNAFKQFNREQVIQRSSMYKGGQALQDFGRKLGGMSAQARDIGGQLTRSITMPAMGAVTALGSIVAVKGFGRLVGIDTARAKLEGLGHDAESTEVIMDSAMDSVLGTSFGFAEAATTAASAVAAGIEPGKELTQYLTTTGDAAAIAGIEMGEMGSILNRVKTANKAYNGELQQLSDRGLPIYQWLAEEAGVTADAVFDMASKGEISSEMLMDAIEENIGGAAKIMGEKSFTAAISNMWSAVGRLGASFLDAGEEGGGFFSQLKPLIGDFTESLDSMGDTAELWGVRFGRMFAELIEKIKAIKDSYDNLPDLIQNIIKKILLFGSVFAVAIGPIITGFGVLGGAISAVSTGIGGFMKFLSPLTKGLGLAGGTAGTGAAKVGLLTKAFRLLGGPVGWIITAITVLVSGFTLAYKKSDTFKNGVDGLVKSFKDALKWIRDFGKAIAGIWSGDAFDQEGAMDLLHHLGLSDEQVKMVFDVVENIKGAYESMKDYVQENLEAIKQFFIDRFGQIMDWWDSTGSGIYDSLVETFSRVKDDVSDALSGVKDFFIGIFQDIKSWWSSDGEVIFDAVGTVFENMQKRGERAWGILGKAVEIAIDIITGLIETFAPIVEGIFNVLWPTIVYLTQTAWEKIKLAIGIAMDLIMGIISGISALIEGDWKKFGEVIKDTAKSIWDRVVEFFGNMMSNTLDTANELTGGMIDKFIEMRDGVIEWVLNLIEKALFEWERLKKYTQLAISTMVHNVKQFFIDLWNNVTETVSNIRDGVVDRFTQLKDRVIEKVDEIFGPTIQTFKDIYNAVTSKVEEIRVTLTEIWKRIRAIITSTVKGIYNSVKEWFLKIYNNVKDRITNLKNRLNELWTSIRNRIVEIVKNIYNRVKDWFLRIFNNVDERTKGTRKRVTELWRSLRDRVVNTVKNLYNRVKDWFLKIYNNIRDRVIKIRNTAVNWFTKMRDTVVSRVKTLYNRVSGWFSDIYTAIHNKMRDAKNKAVGFAKSLYTGAKDQFKKLVTAAKDMMDDIGGWIDKKKNAVVGKARSLGTSIANAAIRGFNSLIGGINKVADFLGVSKKNQISKIGLIGGTSGNVRGAGYRAIRASKGLKDHKGGDVLVGDKGFGNTIGGGSSTREIVQLPDGKNFLMDGNIMLRNAPKGLRVHSNKDTEAILASNPQLNPDLVGGSGALSILNNSIRPVTRMVDNQQKTAKVTHDVTGDIMEYADNPEQLARDIISKYTKFKLPKFPLDLAWAGVKNMTSAMGKKFKKWFDDFNSGGDGSHILGKKIYQRFGRYTGGIGFNKGIHYGLDTAHRFDPLLSPVNGKVTRVWRDFGGGNSLEVTTDKYIWWFMHLSRIIKKVGDRVRAGMKLGTTGNTGNFVVGSGHLHTQVHPRSKGAGNHNAIDPLPVLKGLKGYYKGDITDGIPELAFLNEEGFKESIISHNPSHSRRSEAIWNQTGEMLGFNNNKETIAELRENNRLLRGILKETENVVGNTDVIKNKNPKIVIDEFKRKWDRRMNDTTIIAGGR